MAVVEERGRHKSSTRKARTQDLQQIVVNNRSWARNEGAVEAIKTAMSETPGLKVTLPNLADEGLLNEVF